MRREDLVLESLRRADCIVYLANKIGGPKGFKSALRSGGGAGVTIDAGEVDVALHQMEVAKAVCDQNTWRLVRMAADTVGCTCVRSVRDIAALAGVPASTARRRLRAALDAIGEAFDRVERKAA